MPPQHNKHQKKHLAHLHLSHHRLILPLSTPSNGTHPAISCTVRRAPTARFTFLYAERARFGLVRFDRAVPPPLLCARVIPNIMAVTAFLPTNAVRRVATVGRTPVAGLPVYHPCHHASTHAQLTCSPSVLPSCWRRRNSLRGNFTRAPTTPLTLVCCLHCAAKISPTCHAGTTRRHRVLTATAYTGPSSPHRAFLWAAILHRTVTPHSTGRSWFGQTRIQRWFPRFLRHTLSCYLRCARTWCYAYTYFFRRARWHLWFPHTVGTVRNSPGVLYASLWFIHGLTLLRVTNWTLHSHFPTSPGRMRHFTLTRWVDACRDIFWIYSGRCLWQNAFAIFAFASPPAAPTPSAPRAAGSTPLVPSLPQRDGLFIYSYL